MGSSEMEFSKKTLVLTSTCIPGQIEHNQEIYCACYSSFSQCRDPPVCTIGFGPHTSLTPEIISMMVAILFHFVQHLACPPVVLLRVHVVPKFASGNVG